MKIFFYKYGLITCLIVGVSQLAVAQTFFGTTRAGGTTGGGTIFRVNADGSGLTTDYNFQVDANPGRGPDYCQMVLVNGILYGVMPNGGKNDTGILFSYNPIDNTYAKKIDFDDQVLTGWGPIGTLCLANGKLYGTTKEGGTKYNGTIFQYDPTNNTFTKKIDFDKTISGATPLGGLTSATNGKFYGMTIGGGANDKGILFEYDGASTITKKIDFDGPLKGSLPLRNLKEVGGKLYGMTVVGGINDKGVLFEYDPAGAGTFAKKFDFDGSANGSGPVGSLLLAANGKFYGTTISGGGVLDKGTLFEYTPGSTTITTKVVFDGVAKGAKPGPELVQMANGKIYGTTEVGGTLDIGVLFEYDPSLNVFTKMIDFEYVTKGNIPKGGLVLANNKLYGTTAFGGAYDGGTLFEFVPSPATFTKKIDFNQSANGIKPENALVALPNGKLYGLTPDGATNGQGVIFEYDPITKVYTKKFEFSDWLVTGANPYGSLVLANNGKLYGMTQGGGLNNVGVLFEYDIINATYTKKFEFGSNNGANPYGGLMLSSNGNLYGMTTFGGQNNKGILFEYVPGTTTITKKIDFAGINGSLPHGNLMIASNGKFYGMTEQGGTGTNNMGVLFEYDLGTNTLTNKVDFLGTTNGRAPICNLIQAANGKLYGVTQYGGANDNGVIFEFDPVGSGSFTKKIDFDSNGNTPWGSLSIGASGKLIGLTGMGGTNNLGTVFEYDPVANTITKKNDFNGTNGAFPGFGFMASIIFPPTINSFAPASGAVGTSVTIDGTNFSTTPASNLVYFGATKAAVISATTTQLTVTVPVGATYQPITVLTNGLLAYSSKPFVVTFNGATGIDASSFAAKTDFTTGTAPYSVSIGDLDGDGKADLAVANRGSNTVSIFRNTGSSGSVNYGAKVDFITGTGPISVSIGDLDGDGKADLAVANEANGTGNTVSVFRNTGSSGSISYADKVDFITGTAPRTVSIGDLDGDGRADLAIANDGSGTVSIFRNTGSLGSINYATKVDFVTGARALSVAIGDIDGDGKADLAVANYGSGTVSVFRNTSSAGSISYATKVDFTTGGGPHSVSIGDLDEDGKADLALANYGGVGTTISVFRNTGSVGSISYAAKVDFTSGTLSTSISIGNLDGDGKSDLVVANYGSNTISVFRNTGSVGSISYAAKVDFTTQGPIIASIGDLDGDGKADLAVTNDSDNTVSVFRNTVLPAPTITSFTPTSAGSGTTVTIIGTNFTGATAVSFGGTAATSYNVVLPTSITAVVGNGTTGRLSVTTPQGIATGSVEIASSTIENNSTGWSGSWQKVTTTNKGSLTSVVLKLDNGSNSNDYNLFLELHKTDNNPNSLDPSNKFSSLLEASVSVTVAKNTTPKEITFLFSGVNVLSATTSYYVVLKETSGNPIGTGEQRVYKSSTGTDGAAGGNSGTLYYKFSMSPVFYVVPSILSFAPVSAPVGTAVTISGAGFSTTVANNIVKFNGTVATINGTPTATSIVTTVPATATPGKITVDVGGQVATSTSDFTVTTTVQITIEAFPATYDKGSTLTVSVTVNDANNVSAVNFKSRGISEDVTATKSVPMTAVGNKYEKVVAAADLKDELGLVYSFEVLDKATPAGVVNSTTGKAYVKHPVSSTGQVLPYSTFGNKLINYQIIAVPLDLTDKKVTSVFKILKEYDKSKWRLFDYASADNREYPGFSNIDAGKGYWLIVKESTAINLGEGKAVAADDVTPFQITLASGWNLIGNPYNFNVLWSDVLAANSTVTGITEVDAKLTTFSDGTLSPGETVLKKYRGAFVKSNNVNPVILKIPVKYNSAAGRVAQTEDLLNNIDQVNWEVKLALEQDGLRSEMGGIGMNLKATLKGKDEFDKEHVPLPFDIAEISSPHPEVSSFFNKDIVPTQENFTWQFDVNRSAEEGDIELSWANHYFGESEKQLILFDPATLQVIDMRLVNRFTIRERTKKLHVLFGNNEYIQQALDKELPWLGSAYPNPAKEELTIPFRVTESQNNRMVQIKIYNSQGVEIATPIHQTLPKGNYDVKWQPKGETGLYIIRMTIGQQETKAMKVIIN